MENKQPSVVDDDNEVGDGKTVIVVDTVNDSSDDEKMKTKKKYKHLSN